MLLATGELPAVFTRDDFDALLEEMRHRLGNLDSLPLSPSAVFTDLVRDHLHVVLCCSPAGNQLRERVRRFPSFLLSTSVLWFPPWPKSALRDTARVRLKPSAAVSSPVSSPATTSIARNLEVLAEHSATVHVEAFALAAEYSLQRQRHVFTTPQNFLEFLSITGKVYDARRLELDAELSAVTSGVRRMDEVYRGIADMKVQLNEKRLHIVQSATKLDALLVEIQSIQAVALAKTAQVEAVRNKCKAQADLIQVEKNEADMGLAAALPALQAAEEALRTIRSDDIGAVKKFQTPPMMVRRIMDGVLLLQRGPIDVVQWDRDERGQTILRPSWASAKTMMSDMHFLQHLMQYNKDAVTPEEVELLQPYLRAEDFTADRARVSCASLAGLCTWIRSMVVYHHIAKSILPKKERVRLAEKQLAVALTKLKAAEDDLAREEQLLTEVRGKYDAAQQERVALEADADVTRRRLETAENLISGLAEEKHRWAATAQECELKIARLEGDSMQCAAFLVYGGPLDVNNRRELLHRTARSMKHLGVKFTESLPSPESMLASADEVSRWHVGYGLPHDALSVQNATLLARIDKYPLLIDPQCQGKQWVVQTTVPAERLIFTTVSSAQFVAQLEHALTKGLTLVVEDLESDLSGQLLPIRHILSRQFERSYDLESNAWINVTSLDAGREVVVHPCFKMILCTRHVAPVFTPELFAQVLIVEYGVTRRGLEDQLLGVVISHDKASLERDRAVVLKRIQDCRATLRTCEEQLLKRLNAAVGNLLDDDELVSVLHNIKAKAIDVAEKLAEAVATDRDLECAREEFRPIAARGGSLFVALMNMRVVHSVYVTSMQSFMSLFSEQLDRVPSHATVPKRVAAVVESLTAAVMQRHVVSFYNSAKPIFGLFTAVGIDLERGATSDAWVSLLYRGPSAANVDGEAWRHLLGHCSWLSEESAQFLVFFSARQRPAAGVQLHPVLQRVAQFAQTSPTEWQRWSDGVAPETQPPPLPPGTTPLSPFEMCLLVRSLRPDRFLAAVDLYTTATLKAPLQAFARVNFSDVAAECAATNPILCLLAEGVDPTSSIEAAARAAKAQLLIVSMGSGQEHRARSSLAQAAAMGLGESQPLLAAAGAGASSGTSGGGAVHWLVLQNVHLNIAFCLELAETLRDLRSKGRAPPGFRLWLTSAADPKLPVALLQQCLRLSDEPPRGVRAGLHRALSAISQDQLDGLGNKEWRSVMFASGLIHTALIERRGFGPLGWAHPYEFTSQDVQAAMLFLCSLNFAFYETKATSAQGRGGTASIPWKAVQFMLTEVHFGGRITDDFDKRVIDAYAEKWLNDGLTSAAKFEFAPGIAAFDAKSTAAYHDVLDGSSIVDSDESSVAACGFFASATASRNVRLARQTFRMLWSAAVANSEGSGPQGATGDATNVPPSGGGADGGMGDAGAGVVVERFAAASVVCREIITMLPPLPPSDAVVPTVTAMARPRTSSSARRDGAGAPGGDSAALGQSYRQEVDRLTLIVRLVDRDCRDVLAAVAGTAALSSAVSDTLDLLVSRTVPQAWLAVSWPVDALGTWMSGLKARAEQLHQWSNPRGGSLRTFWLPGFFFPRALMACMRQDLYRTTSASGGATDGFQLDNYSLRFDATRYASPEALPGPSPVIDGGSSSTWNAGAVGGGGDSSCYFVHGLQLEGAAWDREALCLTAPPPRQTSCPLPVIRVSLIDNGAASGGGGLHAAPNPSSGGGGGHSVSQQASSSSRHHHGSAAMYTFPCPVYQSSRRTMAQHVVDVPLRCNQPPGVWTLAGTAAVLNVSSL